MSRSRKKPIVVCSKPRDETHRRRERRKIKEIIRIDPDSDMLNADPKELGGDDWGTKFDATFDPEYDDDDSEERKARRK